MSAGELGFFLGVAPGVGFTLWNMALGQRMLNQAQRIARAQGEMLDLAFSHSSRFYYLFRPTQFIRAHDGEGVRQAKLQLLAMRRPFLRRHALGALLIVSGGCIGFAIALGAAPES